MSFVNLHAHSHYSLLDGFGTPKDIVLRAKELGYPAAALTDHGVTYGLIEFYYAATEASIKPILGCEMYVAPRTRFDKEAKIDNKPYHLTVLAKDSEGYHNLLKLTTKANLEGFYYKPRVDYGLLKAYSKGLIVLSGCIAGHLPRLILSGNDEEACNLIEKHIEIFGKENYFLEIQDNPLMENQVIVNEKLKTFGKKYGLGLVLTYDSHYPRPEDSEAHDILLCIQTQTNVNDENRMRYIGDYSIRDINELREAYKDFPGAIENTLKIADACNVKIDFGKNLIPSFKTPQNESPEVYLKMLCEEGLKNRFGGKKIPADYKNRLKYELTTVHNMGFDTYFLIVHDFVKYAKEKNITVGPGRGSAAGSILAWSLNITDLDPIEYGLLFERFLNPERVSMPDIDIDFADNRRDEVLNYVIEKYGRDNVSQIITFGTMAPRAAVRDTGRALGYPYDEVDQLAKTIPPPVLGKNTPLCVSIKDDPALGKAYKDNERARILLDHAVKLEGTLRHAGTHACAVVISEDSLTEYTALQYGAGGGTEIVTQYSMKPLEDIGLLKMDFLGLKNLTIIEQTEKIVKVVHDKEVDIKKIPLDDKKTFALLQHADTTGVFQLESAGMKRYLKNLKPTEFDDIVAMGALYRPGPMEWIPQYIEGKHHPEKVHYLHESFKKVLQPTHGVAVYQEQILQIARDFAGFTLGEADILRKAVGKKIGSLLTKQREKFIEGAVKNGHKKQFAEEVFDKVIEPFAGYGFNKAHAVCYGLIAYQTAYLKAHFPTAFMTALLCSDAGNTDRIVLEIKECIEMGIDVLPPSINESGVNFTVINNDKIRFGLLATKGVGEGSINEIIVERIKGGEYTSLENFARRVSAQILNKKLIQALALSGAFDDLGDRNQISENYDGICKYAKLIQQSVTNGQTDIFGFMGDEAEKIAFTLKKVPQATSIQHLKWEKEFLGLYVSGHPLRGLKSYIAKKANLIGELTQKQVGKTVKVLGMITNLKKVLTKNGGYMATFVIEDPSGKVNGIMFPKALAHYGAELNEDLIIGFNGKLDHRRSQYQVICDTAKVLSLDTMMENAKKSRLYKPDDKSDIVIRLLDDILTEDLEAIVPGIEGKSINVIENFDVGDVCDCAKNDSYLIEIPASADNEIMTSLKDLLMKHRGDTDVELYLSNVKRRIKLPFKIKISDELKADIDSLLVAN
ncbi:DNA polymerase III subunit alpha [Candidatus Peregrinibacteria bacterium RIFCSPLOWO2_01_FULL_39_12]|nr:MAG: DNA polymerase III subunit alpha [Candidatus Peregrinibacteria bacterium RIFCSPLOWO2_01_FULL_39_12]